MTHDHFEFWKGEMERGDDCKKEIFGNISLILWKHESLKDVRLYGKSLEILTWGQGFKPKLQRIYIMTPDLLLVKIRGKILVTDWGCHVASIRCHACLLIYLYRYTCFEHQISSDIHMTWVLSLDEIILN